LEARLGEPCVGGCESGEAAAIGDTAVALSPPAPSATGDTPSGNRPRFLASHPDQESLALRGIPGTFRRRCPPNLCLSACKPQASSVAFLLSPEATGLSSGCRSHSACDRKPRPAA
jgi:hypothetical protein